ncbi:alpha/beta fold hydrolase [Sphingosinicella sp. BN140058]|uniref:alpha/beta fold hydrolase n=1 Tax=Sphingosinicella sp. BN140058 TaxID=1892855 RepID=UPI0010104277|nr:alpha/beta hydrolase [Sphingosinicella sp. BN140058]QAY80433.1 alpha/beta hydrolase [Sphingosinicella sp. BN140058]
MSFSQQLLSEQALNLTGPLAHRHRVKTFGAGPKILVFSHGLGTDQSSWSKVIPDLPDLYTAVTFDLPGAGPLLPDDFSPDRYSSIAAYADDLLALLDELGIDRCTYVGHSVSGMIGALASIEAPSLFDRLILLNASPRYLNDRAYTGGFEQSDLDALFRAMDDNYQLWVAGFAPMVVGADTPSAVLDFADGLLSMRPDVTAHIARMIFQSDLREFLHLVSVPTLVVQSRGDVAVPEQVGHYLAEHISGSSLAWFNGAGHLPHLSAPDEVTKVLNAHLS